MLKIKINKEWNKMKWRGAQIWSKPFLTFSSVWLSMLRRVFARLSLYFFHLSLPSKAIMSCEPSFDVSFGHSFTVAMHLKVLFSHSLLARFFYILTFSCFGPETPSLSPLSLNYIQSLSLFVVLSFSHLSLSLSHSLSQCYLQARKP